MLLTFEFWKIFWIQEKNFEGKNFEPKMFFFDYFSFDNLGMIFCRFYK